MTGLGGTRLTGFGLSMRVWLALIGALSGVAFWAVVRIIDDGLLSDRVALALGAFVTAGCAGMLGLTGRLNVAQSVARSVVLGALISLLITLAALRYATLAGMNPLPYLAMFLLFALALPFLIAQGIGQGFRHYPTLFNESWALAERGAAAGLFCGLVWGVIGLSDLLLSMVGIPLWQLLTRYEVLPMAISGVAVGLGLAVMLEFGGSVVPAMALRLLRVLLPVLLAVVVVFLVAVPFKGLDQVFGSLSAAATFLAIVLVMTTLVTSSAERDSMHEAEARPMRFATRAMAGLVIVPAGLAAWSVWLRVGQHGWTPERLAAAAVALLALGYGGTYLAAALRPAWPHLIRRANTHLAMATLVLLAAWCSVINAERISAHSQLALLDAGRIKPAELEIYTLESWGIAGQETLALLQQRADAGDAALAAVLQGAPAAEATPADLVALRADLVARITLQPPGATATRDAFLTLADAAMLQQWTLDCATPRSDGGPNCVMVVGDFLTDITGEEVLFATWSSWESVQLLGYALADGTVENHQIWQGYDAMTSGTQVLDTLAAAPPSLRPAPLNMMDVAGGIVFGAWP